MSTVPQNALNTAVVAPPLPDAPYRGIEPFRFTDQQIFAARGDETWTLLSNVTLYRAVLLYGDSGTGKSSLVNAGLLPQALKENYVPDRLRVQPFAGREIKIERIRMSSGGEKAAYLPSNFAPAESDASAESIELSLADFRARLEDFRPATDEAESGSLIRAPRTTARPLLIFDQFEEFITLFEEAQRVGTTEETAGGLEQVPSAQHDILKTLVELIQDETLPIKIIFAFREDYFAKLSLLFEYCPELLDQGQRLLPPNIETVPQIIRAPFTNPELRAHFLKHAGNAGSEISEPLAQRIAAELGRRSEGDTANLTELQIVCQRLWGAPDAEKLFAKDGIEGLLKSYGTDVFRHFTPELRDAAVVLLSHMITASNTRNIISEEDLMSRTAQCDFQPSQCTDALTALSRSQIVRREPRHSIYFYEITSEYLVPWIKERVAERKSAEEQRLAEEARQKLEEERAQAVRKFEAEKRRGLIFQRVLAALILLLVVVAYLGVFAYRQSNRAKAAEARAMDAQRVTDRILTAVKLTTSKNKDEALLGVTQLDALIKENRIPSQLKRVLLAPVLSSPDLEVQQAAFKVAIYAAQNDPELARSLVYATETNEGFVQELSGGAADNFQNLTKALPPRLYVHIGDESQRAQARQVADVLTGKGYIVPGIANVGSKAPRLNELRYFRKNDPGMPAPKEIVALLNQATGAQWVESYTGGYESSPNIRPGHFEVWFASVASEETAVIPSKEGTLVLHLMDQDGNTLSGVNPEVKIALAGNSFYDTNKKSGTRFPLEEGEYEVNVNLKGYEPDDQRVWIKAGRISTLQFRLKRKVGSTEADPVRQRPSAAKDLSGPTKRRTNP